MRIWLEKRRSAGYYVDAGAMLLQFEYLMRICKVKLIAKKETLELTLDEIKKLKIIEEKLIGMSNKNTGVLG